MLLELLRETGHRGGLLVHGEYRPPFRVKIGRCGTEWMKRPGGTGYRRGEMYLDYDWPPLTAEMYADYERTGQRGGFELPYHTRRQVISTLVLAEGFENRGRFVPPSSRGWSSSAGSRPGSCRRIAKAWTAITSRMPSTRSRSIFSPRKPATRWLGSCTFSRTLCLASPRHRPACPTGNSTAHHRALLESNRLLVDGLYRRRSQQLDDVVHLELPGNDPPRGNRPRATLASFGEGLFFPVSVPGNAGGGRRLRRRSDVLELRRRLPVR